MYLVLLVAAVEQFLQERDYHVQVHLDRHAVVGTVHPSHLVDLWGWDMIGDWRTE